MGIWWSLVWYLPAAVLLVFLGAATLTGLFARAGRVVAYFWVIAVGGLLVAQSVLPGRALYPFADWTMYSDPAPPREAWAFFLVDDAGGRARLTGIRAVRGPATRALMASSYRALSTARLEEGEVLSAEVVEQVGDFLRVALGSATPRRDRGVQSVEIRWCAWDSTWPGLEEACLQKGPVAVVPLEVR